jgi:YidC/Oxa1 family membrane protein insertase
LQGDFFLTQWAFLGMRWLYESLTAENIVLTIIISTLFIRALTVFGDIRSRKSSMKMQAIQPQLDKLRKKYEKDPQRLNTEQQKLMREQGVSMFGGCLPMLITMPLFFIFIAAFRQWGNEMMVRLILTMQDNSDKGIEMFRGFKFFWVNNLWMPDNGFSPVIATAKEFFSKTNQSLPKLLYFKEHPEALQQFVNLGFFVQNGDTYTLATITDEVAARYDALMKPCIDLYNGYNNGWFIFPVLAGATTYLSTWIMQRQQPQGANSAAGSTNKVMMWLMPVMSFVFCLQYNASFAVYWTFSNIFSLGTSLLINRSFAKHSAALEEANDK